MNQALAIKQLHVCFKKGTPNENHVLRGLNLTANDGDFITIIGSNGAGKSTLLNSIAGAFPTESGAIEVDGKNIDGMPEHKRAPLIGRVFQNPLLGTAVRMTIEENMAIAIKRGSRRGLTLGLSHQLRELIHEQVRKLDLGLENRLKTEVGQLSGGQRQALTLLMATIAQPKVLLLDEHTAALDPKTAEQVLSLTKKIVAENKITTLMVTHNMEDALAFGNRLIMLHAGQIVAELSTSEKANAKTNDLMRLFKENSGTALGDDQMLLR